MVQASISTGSGHPYVWARMDALLWSINERLAGRDGLDLGRHDSGYLVEVLEAAMAANSITCPECKEFNRLTASYCERCGCPLGDDEE